MWDDGEIWVYQGTLNKKKKLVRFWKIIDKRFNKKILAKNIY